MVRRPQSRRGALAPGTGRLIGLMELARGNQSNAVSTPQSNSRRCAGTTAARLTAVPYLVKQGVDLRLQRGLLARLLMRPPAAVVLRSKHGQNKVEVRPKWTVYQARARSLRGAMLHRTGQVHGGAPDQMGYAQPHTSRPTTHTRPHARTPARPHARAAPNPARAAHRAPLVGRLFVPRQPRQQALQARGVDGVDGAAGGEGAPEVRQHVAGGCGGGFGCGGGGFGCGTVYAQKQGGPRAEATRATDGSGTGRAQSRAPHR